MTTGVILHAAAWNVVTLGLVDAIVESYRIGAVGCGRHVRLVIAIGAVGGGEGYVLVGDRLAIRVVHVAAYGGAVASRLRHR